MGTTQQVILTTTVTASAALTQQRFVGADNAPCQAGAVALGVAEVDAAAGDVTPVNVLGIVAVEAGRQSPEGRSFSRMRTPAPFLRSPQPVRPRQAFLPGLRWMRLWPRVTLSASCAGCDMYCTWRICLNKYRKGRSLS